MNRLLLVFSTILLTSQILYSQQIIKEAKISIDLPNEKWELKDTQISNGQKIYFFKRESLKDSQGRDVVPNISIITEKVSKNQDVVTYSAYKRMQTPFDVDSIFIHDSGIIDFENAIGYLGSYQDKHGPHKVYVIYAFNNKRGVQIFFDVTSDLFEIMDSEFKKTLKSLKIIE